MNGLATQHNVLSYVAMLTSEESNLLTRMNYWAYLILLAFPRMPVYQSVNVAVLQIKTINMQVYEKERLQMDGCF